MHCPFCHADHHVLAERRGVVYGYCLLCRGVWSDSGDAAHDPTPVIGGGEIPIRHSALPRAAVAADAD